MKMVAGSPLQFEALRGFLMLKVLVVLVQARLDSAPQSSCEATGSVPSVWALGGDEPSTPLFHNENL